MNDKVAARARVAIVDCGGANIGSLGFALDRLGASHFVTSRPDELDGASHVILPGVGHAADGMARIRRAGLDGALRDLKVPVLGICLGMQLLHDSSEEGATACLGLMPGDVRRMQATGGARIPHMGWNNIRQAQADRSSVLRGISGDAYMYFVHSFSVPVGDQTIASCQHGTHEFAAVVSDRNRIGVQFHPERSGKPGAAVLRNFLELTP